MRPFVFVLMILPAVFFSCDPCNNLDCLASNYDAQFRIVSAGTGSDLVFGTNPIYDKNQIKFYSIKGADTSFFEYKTIKSGGTGYDSVLHVHFYPETEVAYMQLGNNDIDTLNISYKTTDSRCCGTITEITNFRYNNRFDIPGSSDTQELNK